MGRQEVTFPVFQITLRELCDRTWRGVEADEPRLGVDHPERFKTDDVCVLTYRSLGMRLLRVPARSKEIVQVRNVGSVSLGVERGYAGTTRLDWPKGSTVEIVSVAR